jgi:hypothetical protein
MTRHCDVSPKANSTHFENRTGKKAADARLHELLDQCPAGDTNMTD